MKKADKIEIVIGGLGGQGVVTAGIILGHAAFLEGKNVIQTQSYGPEARGTGASSEIIISKNRINYPKVLACDVLVALSAGILSKYYRLLETTGVLIVDNGMIQKMPQERRLTKVIRIPAAELAERELENPIYTNMIALGALIAQTNIVTRESMRQAIKEHVSPRTLTANLKGFDIGLQTVHPRVSP